MISFHGNFLSGGITALYGRSGIGKTTILRMIAGLECPDSGVIEFDKTKWFDSSVSVNVSARERKVGMVFQENSLFPHMTLLQNLDYARDKSQPTDLLSIAVSSLKVDGLMHKFPHELSGGQKRIGEVLRAIAMNSKLILIDEPFSGVDDPTVDLMLSQLKQVQEKLEITMVLVSHRMDLITSLTSNIHHFSSMLS